MHIEVKSKQGSDLSGAPWKIDQKRLLLTNKKIYYTLISLLFFLYGSSCYIGKYIIIHLPHLDAQTIFSALKVFQTPFTPVKWDLISLIKL